MNAAGEPFRDLFADSEDVPGGTAFHGDRYGPVKLEVRARPEPKVSGEPLFETFLFPFDPLGEFGGRHPLLQESPIVVIRGQRRQCVAGEVADESKVCGHSRSIQ